MQPTADPELLELEPQQVEEFLRALAAALRSYRLYEGNSPMLDRFVATLQRKCEALWTKGSRLRLQIEEDHIIWEGREAFPAGEAGSDLPFLFYKDGIREVTFLPGFEEREALALVGVLARVPVVRKEEDDLITLLWQEDFAHFTYETVEATEGIDLPAPPGVDQEPRPIDPAVVRAEREEVTATGKASSTDDFQEALQLLSESELRRLREEVTLEVRDIWLDILNALYDRLEDNDPARQQRIVGLLNEQFRTALGAGRFDRAARLLEELVELAGYRDVLSRDALRGVRSIFRELGKDETIAQTATILARSPERLTEDSVNQLFSYLPPGSIGPLMRVADQIEQPGVQRVLELSIQRLVATNQDEVVDLLRSADPAVLIAALRWVGRLEITSAAQEVARFLQHDNIEIRIAAIESLVAMRATSVGNGLIALLQHARRDLRIAAVRALGELGHTTATPAVEETITSKRFRDVERSEKVAFFEAYGRLAGEAGIPLLDRILNSKGWLGRGEPPEMRAGAALGLAKIRHPAAREALATASNVSDPVVRTAVIRGLQGEVR